MQIFFCIIYLRARRRRMFTKFGKDVISISRSEIVFHGIFEWAHKLAGNFVSHRKGHCSCHSSGGFRWEGIYWIKFCVGSRKTVASNFLLSPKNRIYINILCTHDIHLLLFCVCRCTENNIKYQTNEQQQQQQKQRNERKKMNFQVK